MNIADQLQVVENGLLDPNIPPETLEPQLNGLIHRVVNWELVRPALEVLDKAQWFTLDKQWGYFIQKQSPLDLQQEEAREYMRMVVQVKDSIRESIRILRIVHPAQPTDQYRVKIDATDFESLQKSIEHINEVVRLASVGKPIKIAAYQYGSLEILLLAVGLSQTALTMMDILTRYWKTEKKRDTSFHITVINQFVGDKSSSPEAIGETIRKIEEEEFWAQCPEIPKEAGAKTPNEIKTSVSQGAKRMFQFSADLGIQWLPPRTNSLQRDMGLDVTDVRAALHVAFSLPAPQNQGGSQDSDDM